VLIIGNGAEAFELLLLVLDEAQRKIMADPAQLNRGDVAGNSDLLERLELNRKAMRIPPRRIWRFKAGEILLADNDILEHLVQRRAKMNIGVCIRRAIVEHVKRLAFVFLKHPLIQMFFIPFFHHDGFLLGKPSAH
jgi:hypothetical protein